MVQTERGLNWKEASQLAQNFYQFIRNSAGPTREAISETAGQVETLLC
jgi:hypothetical protein